MSKDGYKWSLNSQESVKGMYENEENEAHGYCEMSGIKDDTQICNSLTRSHKQYLRKIFLAFGLSVLALLIVIAVLAVLLQQKSHKDGQNEVSVISIGTSSANANASIDQQKNQYYGKNTVTMIPNETIYAITNVSDERCYNIAEKPCGKCDADQKCFNGCIAESTQMITLPVYYQARNESKGMIKSGLPGLSEFTACFWFAGEPDDDNRHDDYLLSFASSENHNEILIGFWSDTKKLHFYRGGNYNQLLPITKSATELSSWDSKHRHCFVWKDGEYFKWYLDVSKPGHMEMFKSLSITNRFPLAAGSTLAILQDQDTLGGSFESHQTTSGAISSFNLWNYAMTEPEVAALPCGQRGNVVNPSNIEYFEGTPNLTRDTFPCNIPNPAAFIYPNEDQCGIFCRLEGYSLQNSVFTTTESPSASDCLRACLRNAMCLSANYRISRSVCQLNHLRHNDTVPANFVRNLGNDYVHFTSRRC